MKRKDKIRAVKRYIVANTGIPGIMEDGNTSDLLAPWPYKIRVSTSHSMDRINKYVRLEARRDMIDFAVRYDMDIETVDSAIVHIPLETFTQILSVYHQHITEGRETDAP
jgi:hypothetical protein